MKIFLQIIIVILFSTISYVSNAQCDQALIDGCSQGDSKAKYVKHFRIRFAESKNIKKRSEGQFTMMLMKGNHYRFYVCNDDGKEGKAIVHLSSDFGNYGSNYNDQTNSEYRAFDFICSKTGPYYLKMFFKDGKEGCGVCVVSLVVD